MKKRGSLKWSMLNMLAITWLLPLILIAVVLTAFISRSLNTQVHRTISTTMEKAVEICTLRLNDCIEQSKDISYNGRLREIYEQYQKDGNESALYTSTSSLLGEKYKFNDDYRLTGLYYTDQPERVYYTGSTYLYESQRYYQNYARELIQEASEVIDTDTVLVTVNNRVYLVRNVMDHNFRPYAVLFMDLNEPRIFESLKSVWQYQSLTVFFAGEEIYQADDAVIPANHQVRNGTVLLEGVDLVYSRRDLGSNEMLYAVKYNRDAVQKELATPVHMFILILLFMIPLAILIVRFVTDRVSKPVEELVSASEEITRGNYGVTVPVHTENGEISDLDMNFNTMSLKLKDQFEKIYVEEIALRDANIHALQSQINPHFLNNTLEIINWEARMDGNEQVSKMIEALSTMLGATLNREKRDLIPLREELEYVDAYLYIIECRFKDRFECTRTIEFEESLEYAVPRLIIQPIIENAVEHGRSQDGTETVSIEIKGGKTPKSDLTIIVKNSGVPDSATMERIHHLLNDETTEETHSTHIGIRNVNKRLKILFGEESGLTIEPDGEGNTVSAIFVKKSQL